MTVEDRINNYIEDHHINRAAVARGINMNLDSFYSILNGKRKMKVTEFKHLCDFLDVKADLLLDYKKEENTDHQKSELAPAI